MKIKSDRVTENSELENTFKKYEITEIAKTIAYLTLGLASIIWLMVTLMNVAEKQKKDTRTVEEKQIKKIIKYKPLINCFNNDYLPEEYNLEIVNGNNILKVFYPERNLDKSFLLSDCKLILTKPKSEITDKFRNSILKKRKLISKKENNRIDRLAEEKIKKDLPSGDRISKKIMVFRNNRSSIIYNSDNSVTDEKDFYIKVK